VENVSVFIAMGCVMGCSSSSPSGSLSLVVGLCRMGGPVLDLVNALDFCQGLDSSVGARDYSCLEAFLQTSFLE